MKNKVWRKMACAALCAGLCLSMAAKEHPVQAASARINIQADGFLQTGMEMQAYAENGLALIGSRDLAEALGCAYDWDAEEQKATMQLGRRQIVLTAGQDVALVGYNEVKTPVKITARGGQAVVPLRFVAEALGAAVRWDGKNNAVLLDTMRPDYVVMQLPAYTVQAPQTMTYGEALEKLNANTSSIHDMVFNLEIMKENKEELDKKVKDVFPSDTKRKNEWRMNVIELLREQKALNTQILTTNLNLRQTKESNELSLRSAITAIEETRLDIYVLEQKIALEETGLANAELKLSLGIETAASVRSARLNLEQSQSSLQGLRLRQERNQIALNNLLGLPQGKNAVVTGFDVTQETEYNRDVDAFVAAQYSIAPSVVTKALEFDVADFKVYSYYELLYKDERDVRKKANELTQNERTMENDRKSKERALADAKLALDKKIRDSHNSLQQLEESYASLQIDRQKAVESYARTLAGYYAGMATVQELDQARMNILNAEISIQKNRISYASETFAHTRP